MFYLDDSVRLNASNSINNYLEIDQNVLGSRGYFILIIYINQHTTSPADPNTHEGEILRCQYCILQVEGGLVGGCPNFREWIYVLVPAVLYRTY